ncbi:hypothetical protein BD410DRAFT_843872 [Rickenella mellea]|uniref:Uncharacterized protein n=1 Tax=Rickenella mellea TaxID=50990 RepID=A0A4Y7PPG0_9AGAM|nr:hypothetical protein BD410DRAFT_843872 [Rickenella mellea]
MASDRNRARPRRKTQQKPSSTSASAGVGEPEQPAAKPPYPKPRPAKRQAAINNTAILSSAVNAQAKEGDEVSSQPKIKKKKNVHFEDDTVAEREESENVTERNKNEDVTSVGGGDCEENQTTELDIQSRDDGGIYVPSASDSDDEDELYEIDAHTIDKDRSPCITPPPREEKPPIGIDFQVPCGDAVRRLSMTVNTTWTVLSMRVADVLHFAYAQPFLLWL